ncbi:MAG: beta-ureidopropionase / N-carbamoyl-L-amino-acid hydrolase [Alphaproteobacteria bacterium]|nr:beta-ureidopropionase / N-carbamoyl-L-amino-acid hydrolase [Alphaproteobacteria bacterium]
MRNLAIDAERLWGEIMETASIGGTPKGGICRLTLTDLDRQVRDWFKARAEQLGCRVTVDDMGAMFARREGTADVPPIAFGSHLDTQPTGGKFDGVLGVLGALEALRTLVEAGYETYAPIEVVNWTNEEGSRFAPAMVSSGVFAKVLEKDWAQSRKDREGMTFAAALEQIGYRGAQRCGEHPLAAFFELHIEQGPILEAEGKDIGVVTGVQAMRWYEVTITGQDAHTGATPMHLRRNALLGAARLIEAVDTVGRKHPPGVATVGRIENRPNSPNVVPGEVFLMIDLRHPDGAALNSMESDLRAALSAICEPLGLNFAEQRIWDQPAVCFHADCVAAVRHAAELAGYSARDIVSGAGHDVAYVSRIAPAAMIFVPCRGGISHNEAEFSSKEQCAKGAQVLLQAGLDYDRQLAERGGAKQS